MSMVEKTVFLKEYSSLRVGGEGKLIEVATLEELKEAAIRAKDEGLSLHTIGEGTNSYFGDNLSGFLFLKLPQGGIEYEEQGDQVLVKAGANVIWDDLVQECISRGLWGIENLSYIPGTVGAAPVQNIGAYGAELSEVFVSLDALDLATMDKVTLDREACQFGYRDSIFKYDKGRYVIVCITLELSKIANPRLLYKPLDALRDKEGVTLDEVRSLVIATRNAKLPNYHEHPNCGSFFKNPIVDQEAAEFLKGIYPDVPVIQVPQGFKIPAGWLIEHVANMKGIRRGDLGTWPVQSLVIVNYGNATADDIDALAREIQEKVNEKTGIVLEQEVNRVG
jgi:UDP-N-acetylmuramate dehydrogenase